MDSGTVQEQAAAEQADRQENSVKRTVYIALAGLLIVMGLGVAAVLWFANVEKERDLQMVQSRLTVVADSRAQAVTDWLSQQFAILNALARNESLQLYTRLVLLAEADGTPEEAAGHRGFLETLLRATAARTGFDPADANPIPANVSVTATSGLALVSAAGEGLVATPGMPPLDGALAAFLDEAPADERDLFDIHVGPNGQSRIGFAVPVFADPGDGGPATVIARVVGLQGLGEGFYKTLVQPGATAETAESYLVRRDGNRITYLTGLLDGTAPLEKALAANTEGLIAAEALSQPGRFHQGRDYAAVPSLAVSRAIAGTDWVLVHRIAADEALAASLARRNTLVVVLVLSLVLVGAALVAVWRYGTSVRAEESAARYRASSEKFESLSEFLDVVADSQPQPLFVSDGSNVLTFANRRAAEVMGAPKTDLPGRALVAMLGREQGSYYAEVNASVLASREPHVETRAFADSEGHERVWRSYHCPLTLGPEKRPAVLTSVEDMTDFVAERSRRERNTHQLIETLVGLVDERDPDSAHQSRHVATVARTVAAEMGLDERLVQASEQAARLVNIGKIRVPRSLLTKEGALTDTEMETVREALDSGPEILKDIEFEAPVLETLSQINERFDGQGRPQGLPGPDILPSAQVVALANTFVALISPRAFRAGRGFDEVEGIVMAEIGQRFAREPVLSLLHFLNNKNGRREWAGMAVSSADADRS